MLLVYYGDAKWTYHAGFDYHVRDDTAAAAACWHGRQVGLSAVLRQVAGPVSDEQLRMGEVWASYPLMKVVLALFCSSAPSASEKRAGKARPTYIRLSSEPCHIFKPSTGRHANCR